MNPRAAVEAAFDAYSATRGRPVAEQDAARLKYDAAVREHERRNPTIGIESTRDRMRALRDAAKVKRPTVRRDAWGYPVDE